MPIPPSYADRFQRDAFARWMRQQRSERGLSKSKLAKALGHDTIQQISKFEKGVALPMPATLRVIASHLKVPWIVAFAIAGYYEEVLRAIADLERLSAKWIDEDAGQDRGSFRQLGVIRFRELSVLEALEEPYYRSRYSLYFWEENLAEQPSWSPEIDPEVRAMIEAHGRDRRTYCVVPKPLAAAILIAITAFPRRGDVYKDETVDYGIRALSCAATMIDAAMSQRRRSTLPPLLQRANHALKDRSLDLDRKRVIAAEYVVLWADSECQRFTHIARLGAMQRFGVAGSSVSNRSIEEDLPLLHSATLPDPSEFSFESDSTDAT